MVRTFAIATTLGLAIAMPLSAGAKGKKVTPSDIPIVKHYDKASTASSARSGVDGETKEGHHSGTATQARDVSSGQASGKRTHHTVRAMKETSSKPAALTPTAPSPQPLPYPNSSK